MPSRPAPAPSPEALAGGPRLVPDRDGGVMVFLDGQAQSHVNLDDPLDLGFEYVAHFALVLDTLTTGPLRATHVGGAGLTLPRWIAHTRPGSTQIVLEPNSALTDLVRRELPLPRGHRIRVRPQDGATGIVAIADDSADVLVIDAYADGRVPADLVTDDFLRHCARVLTPTGLLLMNLADEPGLRYAALVAATARLAFGEHVALIATREVLKNRRFGNAVLIASPQPWDLDRLQRAVGRMAFPTGLLDHAGIMARFPGAQPLSTRNALRSPHPPATGTWRLR